MIEPANAPNGVLFWIAPRIEPANATNGVLFWIGLGFAARTGLGECSLGVMLWIALLHMSLGLLSGLVQGLLL